MEATVIAASPPIAARETKTTPRAQDPHPSPAIKEGIKPLLLEFTGRGDVKGNYFKQMCRAKTAAMYQRNSICGEVGYEVFRIRVDKPRNIFGRNYG